MIQKKYRLILAAAVCAVMFVLWLTVNESRAYTPPTEGREDIRSLVMQETFAKEDYETFLRQTGLGKAAVDDLKAGSENFAADMLGFQEQYFAPALYECEFVFPTTKEERLVRDDGKNRLLTLAPVQNGDVIITRGTHTLGWRHGHAAIVTDAENGETLESVLLGQKSSFQELDKWRKYPSVLLLRPKQQEAGEKAAAFAKERLAGVDYSPFVGVKKKDKQKMAQIDSTQCAHLVWQAYRAAGIDLDSNGGWLVTPKDIAYSEELELVQAYGFDPERR